jgi:hypothetical protein
MAPQLLPLGSDSGVLIKTVFKNSNGGCTMSIVKKVVSAILFVSLLALAGCPQVGQPTGGSSKSDSGGGGD